MTTAQLLILIVVSVLVTVPIVLLLPRQRQSPTFDRVLWVSTGLLAFIGAWLAPEYITLAYRITIAEVAIFPTLIGAMAGALAINVPLWVIDRFDQPLAHEDWPEATSAMEDGHDANSSIIPGEQKR